MPAPFKRLGNQWGFGLKGQRPCAAPVTRVAPACLSLALLVVPWPRLASGEPTPRPPTSIEPAVKKQKVLVTHLQRHVRACKAVPAKHPTACTRQLSDSAATTTVLFDPVSAAVGASRRMQIAVKFPDALGLQKQLVELPIGEWVVNWPGCRDAPRLNVTATKDVAPRVALQTISGGCELNVKPVPTHRWNGRATHDCRRLGLGKRRK